MPHLRWTDALLFLVFFIDTYGDTLVGAMLVLYLEANFNASGGLARAIKGVIQVTAAATSFFAGALLDSWPRDAPLLAISYTKPFGALAIGVVVLIDVAGGGDLLHAMCAMAVLIVVFAPGRGHGRVCPTIDDYARVRDER